jgi:hypothetical protein
VATRSAGAPRFALQFNPGQSPVPAGRYASPAKGRIVSEIGPAARERGYYTRPEFIGVCAGKTGRPKSRVAANTSDEVAEATRLALSAGSDRPRIWIPMAPSGVQWATSPVLLHLGHRDRYPILDYRALEGPGIKRHLPTISFCSAYVTAGRPGLRSAVVCTSP